jgi:hypothetical protein
MDAQVGARRRILLIIVLAILVVILLVIAFVSCGPQFGRSSAEVSFFPGEPTTALAQSSPTEASSPSTLESTPGSSTSQSSNELGHSSVPGSSGSVPGSSGSVPGRSGSVPGLSSPRPPVTAQRGPINACGVPPSGRAPDGRALQRIVFPDPGVHQWPDSEVSLRACSTSGLPVTYQFENGGRGGTCYVNDPTATTVRFQSGLGSCQITAHQTGNAEFAPAEPVIVTWIVNKLAIRVGLMGTAETLIYRSSAARVTLQVRVTAINAIPVLTVFRSAYGTCSIPPGVLPSIGGKGSNDITFDVEVDLTDPGEQVASCTVTVGVHANQITNGGTDIRTYVVRRSG